MNTANPVKALALSASVMLASCGGGGSSVTPPPTSGVSEAARVAAATATAASNPKCSEATIGSFYWEVGDANGVKASGSIGKSAPTASSMMRIYSASKWLYASYVLEKRNGNIGADAAFLNFTSGYSKFGNAPVCFPDDSSVQGCLLGRDGQDPATIGTFNYDSGHMQHHAAVVMGLGADSNSALGADVNSAIGNLGFSYWLPQPAAGVMTTPQVYSLFLRRVVGGGTTMSSALGTYKVCAQSAVPGCNATGTPDSIGKEAWNYSLGHWVEDDPTVGDHAFSSAGGGGFYPWIDSSKSFYGILARERGSEGAAGYHSAECGRLIRQAWRTGVTVTASSPSP